MAWKHIVLAALVAVLTAATLGMTLAGEHTLRVAEPPAMEPAQEQETRQRTPILSWERSNLHALINRALGLIHGDAEHATKQANFVYRALEPVELGGELDWRNEEPHEVMRRALVMAGIDPEQAMALAVWVLDEMGLDRSPPWDAWIALGPEGWAAALEQTAATREVLRGERREALERQREARRNAGPELQWERSNLHAMLNRGFLLLGWEGQQAADLANLTYRKLDPLEPHLPDGTYDWRNSNPYAVFRDAYMILGFERYEAIGMAFTVLNQMGLQRDLIELDEESDPKCKVYLVTVIWCEGEVIKKADQYMHALIWESVVACPVPIDFVCVDHVWFTMRSTGNCNDLPPNGTCVWVTVNSSPQWVDCLPDIMGRNCFIELNPTTDCETIKRVCGHVTTGPSGCPSCE